MLPEKSDLSSVSAPRGFSAQRTTSVCDSSIAGANFSVGPSTCLKFSGQSSVPDACLFAESRFEWRHRLQLDSSEVSSEVLEHTPLTP
jgi:hypothetical protein